jgi:hypothetical protein
MPYLGNTPTTQSFISGTDYFNGTGSQTAFTLTRTVASVNDIEAVVNNVVQQPNDAYNISGTTITFTSAPSAGTNNVYVRYLSTTTQAITPSQNTVGWAQLNADTQQDLGISFKNRIINSNMVIDQRNAGASVTQTTADLFPVDRFRITGTVTSKFTAQRSTTAPTGFINSVICTSSSAYTVGSAERFLIGQAIEGFNVADLGWGTANAKTVTLSFWVRSSLTGTFGGVIRNSAGDRSYPFSYTISSANTYEFKSLTITGDTTGTWEKDNNVGMFINFSLGAGSTLLTTAGAWAAGSFQGVTGQVNLVGTNGATLFLTGVQLEVGTQATTFTTAGGSYGAELVLCQRYFQVYGGNVDNEGISSGVLTDTTEAQQILAFKVEMRANPTGSSPSSAANSFVFRGAWGAEARTSSNLAYSAGARGTNIQVSTSGKTAGQAGILRVGTDLGKIFFSAEL